MDHSTSLAHLASAKLDLIEAHHQLEQKESMPVFRRAAEIERCETTRARVRAIAAAIGMPLTLTTGMVLEAQLQEISRVEAMITASSPE